MPQVLSQPTEKADPPMRWVWTRRDCEDFEARGLLMPGKYELIEGEILRKMPQKPPHATVVMAILTWMIDAFSSTFVLSQCAIDVSPEDNPTSNPEPDAFVLKRAVVHFQTSYPSPDDLSLVIEVSDSTLAFDLSTKAGTVRPGRNSRLLGDRREWTRGGRFIATQVRGAFRASCVTRRMSRFPPWKGRRRALSCPGCCRRSLRASLRQASKKVSECEEARPGGAMW